jgi:hypothetical protein
VSKDVHNITILVVVIVAFLEGSTSGSGHCVAGSVHVGMNRHRIGNLGMVIETFHGGKGEGRMSKAN